MKEVICAGCGQYESECRCEGQLTGNRIEEVKKIIESHRSTCEFGNPPVTHGSFTDKDVELSAKQIDDYYCQLFPQPLDDKELRKKLSELILGLDIGSIDIPTDVRLAGERTIADYKANKIYTALLQPKIEEAKERLRVQAPNLIEEAKEQERAYIKRIGAKWPTKTVAQIIDLIAVNEQALKEGE